MLNIQNVEDDIIAIDGPIAIGMDSTIYNYDGKEWKRNFVSESENGPSW